MVILTAMYQINRYLVIILLMMVVITSCVKPTTSAVIILPTVTPKDLPVIPTVEPSPTPIISDGIPMDETVLQDIRLNFWYPWSGSTAGVMDDLIKEFNQTNTWGINIIGYSNGDEQFLEQQVLDSIDNNIQPDLIVSSILFLSGLHTEKNVLTDINTYIDHPKWGISKDVELSFPLSFWQQDLDGNFRFGFPAQRDAHVIFYNQKWAHDLGFKESPTTPDDFLNQACKAARTNAYDNDPENNGTGGWFYNTDPDTVLSWLRVYGGGDLPQKVQDRYIFESKPNQDAFDFLYKISEMNCSWSGIDNDPYRYFADREALFYSGTLQDILKQEKLSMKDEWTVLPYPSKNNSPVILIDGYSYGVFNSSPEKQLAAWLFIKWMTRPENQVKMIEATGTYPLTNTIYDLLGDFRKTHPVWETALQFIPQSHPAPSLDSWAIAGRVLQDAAWQITLYTVKPGDIPAILNRAELLIQSISSQ